VTSYLDLAGECCGDFRWTIPDFDLTPSDASDKSESISTAGRTCHRNV